MQPLSWPAVKEHLELSSETRINFGSTHEELRVIKYGKANTADIPMCKSGDSPAPFIGKASTYCFGTWKYLFHYEAAANLRYSS